MYAGGMRDFAASNDVWTDAEVGALKTLSITHRPFYGEFSGTC